MKLREMALEAAVKADAAEALDKQRELISERHLAVQHAGEVLGLEDGDTFALVDGDDLVETHLWADGIELVSKVEPDRDPRKRKTGATVRRLYLRVRRPRWKIVLGFADVLRAQPPPTHRLLRVESLADLGRALR